MESDSTRLAAGLVAMAVMLMLTVLTIRLATRSLPPNDPKRTVISRVIVWIGTVLLIVILLAIRR